MKLWNRPARVAAVLLVLAASTAQAQVITFDALGGANGAVFSTYDEAGLNVRVLSGQVCVGKAFGNPVPDLFGGPTCLEESSTLSITRIGGGTFSFLATDLATNNGKSMYSFTGYLASLFQYSGGQALETATTVFATYTNPNASLIDELRISLTTVDATSYNIDNINVQVSTVPEPSSLVLLGSGIGALFLVRRRRA